METLNTIVANAVAAAGYQFVGLENVKNGKFHTLRVYIDSDHGVNIDDCSKASKQISAVLDVENVMSHQYHLEVSSPGVNRLLFTSEQYQPYIGKTVKVKMKFACEGRKQFCGILLQASDEMIELQVDDEKYQLPFSDILKANVVFTQDELFKRGKNQ